MIVPGFSLISQLNIENISFIKIFTESSDSCIIVGESEFSLNAAVNNLMRKSFLLSNLF